MTAPQVSEEVPYTTLDAQIDEYLVHLRVERGLSANTLDAYGRDLSDFSAVMIDQGIDDARRVPTDRIAAWVRDLAKSGLAASSQKRMLVAVRGLFRFLVVRHVIEEDPAALVQLPKLAKRLPPTVSAEDVMAMLEVAKAKPRDLALVLLLYGAGLRVSEAVGLDVGDVHLDAGLVRVLGKGNKERVVPLGEPVLEVLRAYLDHTRPEALKKHGPSDALFPSRGKRGRVTRQTAFLLLRKLARAAGLPEDVTPHQLRHAFATHLVQGGADLRSVQVMLGHADLRTTEIYTHVDDQHLRKTYERHHPRR